MPQYEVKLFVRVDPELADIKDFTEEEIKQFNGANVPAIHVSVMDVKEVK